MLRMASWSIGLLLGIGFGVVVLWCVRIMGGGG